LFNQPTFLELLYVKPREILRDCCSGFLTGQMPSHHPTNCSKEMKDEIIIRTKAAAAAATTIIIQRKTFSK